MVGPIIEVTFIATVIQRFFKQVSISPGYPMF